MPRPSLQQVTGVPQAPTQAPQQVFTQVVAAPIPQPASAPPAAPDAELDGLVSGLASFNPHLQNYLAVADTKDSEQAQFSGKGVADKVADPANAWQLPAAMPAVVNPAFRAQFDQAYKKVLGQRIGIQTTATIQAEYDKQKVNPDFNVDSFLQDQMAKTTGGLTDPTVANEVAKQNIDLSRNIRAEDNKIKLGAIKDETVRNYAVVIDKVIANSDNNPDVLAANFNALLSDTKAGWNNYFTRPEMSEKLLQSVKAQSLSDKGNPSIFDALDKIKDPATGMTIAESSPHLGMEIAEGRKAAERAQDMRIDKASQASNFQDMAKINDSLAAGSKEFTDDWIAAHTGGPGSLFSSTEAALAFRKRRDTTFETVDDRGTTLSWMANGMGYLATGAQQKAASDYLTTPMVNNMMPLLNDPSRTADLSKAISEFVNIHTSSRLTVPNEIVTRMVESLSKNPAEKSGEPPPRFLAVAQLYKQMGTNPSVLDSYFKGDSSTLMEAYSKEVASGVAPATAYQNAFYGISSEAKERERELTKDPKWQAKVTDMVSSAVDGLRFTWRDVTPFAANMPLNASGVLQGGGTLEAKRFMIQHPNASDDDLKKHNQKWVSDNYVHDTASNMLVGVPPGVGQAGLKPVEWFQEGLLKKYGADSRPTLVYMGNGQYRVQTLNPPDNKESLTWDQLRGQHAQATQVSPEELATISALNTKATKGTLSSAEVQQVAPLLSKVRSLGLADKLQLQGINNAMDSSARNAIAAIPKLTLGGASNVLTPNTQSANDRVSQKNITNFFLQNAPSAANLPGQSAALTNALITQGEGVVLKASPDPAGGAGNNIGMGYNLNANKATMAEDFRRAGIPPEANAAIAAGTRSITEEQAQRLLQITSPRYAAKAQAEIEKRYPGMWGKMTSQQHAVVTDVAYQVKDFSKFGPSIDALVSGDQARIDAAFKVNYTDHSGVTREDTRRNTLRANMLKGSTNFMSVVANN